VKTGGKVDPVTFGCYYSKSQQGANCKVEGNEDISKNDTNQTSNSG